jgi:hypothetical protein
VNDDVAVVLDVIRGRPGCSMGDIAEALGWRGPPERKRGLEREGLPSPQLSMALARAVERGLVTTSTEGHGRATRCRLWVTA